MTLELTDEELESICFALGNILALDATGAAELTANAKVTIKALYLKLLRIANFGKGEAVQGGE